MGWGDPKSGTRWPGQKNGMRCLDTRWRSRSWTSGPPAPPTWIYPPFKFFSYHSTILNTFKAPKIWKLTSGLQVTSKRTKLYFALWCKNSRNHFICFIVLTAPLQHGTESTCAFGLLPSAAETTTGHQWWPICNWYRSVSYTSMRR